MVLEAEEEAKDHLGHSEHQRQLHLVGVEPRDFVG